MGRKKNDQYLNNNENLPIKVEFDYTPEQIEEIRRCKEDIIYFAENFFYIKVLGQGRQKIKLHEVQKGIIRKITDNNNTIVCASRQTGKALALDTPIPTPNGWTTMGELKDGDQVFDEHGKICNVVKAHEVRTDRPCYELTFSNGEKIVADESHEWFTQSKAERQGKKVGSKKTTKQIFNNLLSKSGEPNHRISVAGEVEYHVKDLNIDPYLLGYWLGDGFSAGSRIIIGQQDIENALKNFNFIKNKSLIYIPSRKCYHLNILKDNDGVSFASKLKHHNLINNKHIPDIFLQSSVEQRLALLQGLMDSDGHCDKRGACEFSTIKSQLAENISELLNSLGIQNSTRTKIPTINGKKCKPVYIIIFKTHKKIFRFDRKLNRLPEQNVKGRNNFIYIKEIKEVKSVPVRCISVDSPSHLFLCGKTMIPTSNSTLMTIVCLWYALFQKDKEVAILANKEVQAKEILDRIKLAYEEIPNYIKAGVWTFSQEIIRLTNGSKIYVSTTSATSLRGRSVDVLFVDEFAFVPAEIAEAFFKSVVPVLCSGPDSKMIITSTPNGVGNKFHELFSNAENGRSTTWAWDRMYWYQIPGRDEAWKAKQLDMIGYDMQMWNQEFEIMFLEDGQSAINLEVIERLKKMCCSPEHSFDNGDYKIWYPAEPEHIYVFGVDVAEGVGQDWSVIQILDITDLTNIIHAGQYAVNDLQPFVFAEKLNQIARAWGRPFLCVESNKEGSQVLDALINVHHYDNIVTVTMKNDKRGFYQKPGIFCHQNSKYTGIMNFKYFIEHLEVVKIFDLATLKEFETFVRKENKTWTAQKGKHDDRVMSMIWALFILEKDVAEQYLNVLEYDETGKPCRIADPNQDLANMSFYEPESYSAYAKTGGAPLPTIFHIGGQMVSEQSFEMEKFSIGGWQIA